MLRAMCTCTHTAPIYVMLRLEPDLEPPEPEPVVSLPALAANVC